MINVMRRILIADDNRGHREALARILGRRGYHVTVADDGAEALRVLGEAHFDLVVTDLRMPRLDGLALLRHIRRSHPGVLVIVLSAYGDSISALQASRWGALAFLQKPIQKDDILALVERALESVHDTDIGA